MIEMTEQAVSKVKALLESENRHGHGLRVAVMGGGCSGFRCGLTFEEAQKENDTVLEFDGLKVFVDQASETYLKGAKIDYVDTLQGSGFKIDNPNSQSTCGCGQSFGC